LYLGEEFLMRTDSEIVENKTFSERKIADVLAEPIREKLMDGGVPLPYRSSEIMKLGENLKVIHGAQPLRGKILSRKNLGPTTEQRSAPIRTRKEKLILLPEIIEGNGIATARPECSDNGLPL
jgi:hypothetical protein